MQPFMFSSLSWHVFLSCIPWMVVPSYSYHTRMPKVWAGKTSKTKVLSLKWFTVDKKMYKMWMMSLGFLKSKPILSFTKVVKWVSGSMLFLNKPLRSQRQAPLLVAASPARVSSCEGPCERLSEGALLHSGNGWAVRPCSNQYLLILTH